MPLPAFDSRQAAHVLDELAAKDLAWEFCDRIRWRYNGDVRRMRTNAELAQQLDSIRSPRQLHDEDVPLSQVAGILARTNPALFSFSVFYMENLSEQLLPDVPADCEIWQYRELGYAEPRVDVMVDCHCNGDIDLMCHTAMHAIIDSSDGCRHLLVSDTPWQLPV